MHGLGIALLRIATAKHRDATCRHSISQHCNGEVPKSKVRLGMARRRKLKKYEEAKILYVYDEGSATLDEIYERTGCTRDQVAQVLPVEEIEKREMMDVFKKYGY